MRTAAMTRSAERGGGGVPRNTPREKIRDPRIGPDPTPPEAIPRRPGRSAAINWVNGHTTTEPGGLTRSSAPIRQGLTRRVPSKEGLRPVTRPPAIDEGRGISGAGKEPGSGGGSGGRPGWGARLGQWLRPRWIADGERVGGVYGAPDVRVSIENTQATSGDIWAEVKIDQGTYYVVHDLERTPVELRPLGFQAAAQGHMQRNHRRGRRHGRGPRCCWAPRLRPPGL